MPNRLTYAEVMESVGLPRAVFLLSSVATHLADATALHVDKGVGFVVGMPLWAVCFQRIAGSPTIAAHHILVRAYRLKVRGFDAGTIAAQVVELQASAYQVASRLLIDVARKANALRATIDVFTQRGIAVRQKVASPYPAISRPVDLRPHPFVPSRLLPQRIAVISPAVPMRTTPAACTQRSRAACDNTLSHDWNYSSRMVLWVS